MEKNIEIQFLKEIQKAYEAKKVVLVFGAGENGKIIKRSLKKKGYHITAFLDNNEKKQGKKIGKIPILSPEVGKETYPDALIIISNTAYYREMTAQVKNGQNSIFICTDEMILGLQYLYYDKWHKEDKYFIYHHPILINKTYIWRLMKSSVESLNYKIKMALFQPKMEMPRKYNVSICGIFKNEANYLKEWIEYHEIVGIQHFYLYNNCSDDNFMEVLEPYLSKNIVTLIDWPFNQAQLRAYRDCIERYGGESQWIGFIDLDEFVVPLQCDNIYTFLRKFNKKGSVLIHWKVFGSSGMIERDVNNLVIEDFTSCWPKHSDVGKCFFNTSFGILDDDVKNGMFHHFLWTEYGGRAFPPVNIFNKICLPGIPIKGALEFPIQINHYVTKSYSEYQNKVKGTDVYFKQNPHTDDWFLFHDEKCSSNDDSIGRYLAELKKKMSFVHNEL